MHSNSDSIDRATIRPRFFCGVLAMILVALGAAPVRAADPLLPDLISWSDEVREFMYGGMFDLTSEPGRVLYRFNTVIPNIGDGPFEIFEITHPDNSQDVYQNIHNLDGSVTQVHIEKFLDIDDPPFGHLHLEALAQYSLREVTPGGGVGPIVATHFKTSHGLVDSLPYDLTLPNAPTFPRYFSAGQNPVGVSVGWGDFYGKSIPKQRIDVTGVPSGQYWLEVNVDPLNRIIETNDDNNIERILVDLDIPVVPEPGSLLLLAALSLLPARRRAAV